MSLEKAKKEKITAIFYTVSAVVLACLVIYSLVSTYLYMADQKKQILQINQKATEVQQKTFTFNQQIKEARETAANFIPSNFEEFFSSQTTTGDLTRMFDTLEQTYKNNGQNFLIRSISYGQVESLANQKVNRIRASLSLTTTADNLIAFLRDIEKTGLSSERAFYFLDPLSLNFNNISGQTNSDDLNIDLQLSIILRQN